MKLITLTSTLLLTLNSYALSCIEPRLENFVQKPFILKAKVTKIIEEGKRGEYEVEITKLIKGKGAIQKAKLLVFTWVGNPKFKVEKEYIFFSDKVEEIRTGACGMYFKGDDQEALAKIKGLLKK